MKKFLLTLIAFCVAMSTMMFAAPTTSAAPAGVPVSYAPAAANLAGSVAMPSVTPTGAWVYYTPDMTGRHKTCYGVDRVRGGSTWDKLLCPNGLTTSPPLNWADTDGIYIGYNSCIEYLDASGSGIGFAQGPTYQILAAKGGYRARAFPCSYAKTANATTVASWPLYSTTGYRDTTGRGHNATVDPTYNGVTQNIEATYFNGHGRLNVAPSADFSPGSSNFSLKGKIKTNDLWGNVFQIGNTNGGVGVGAFAKFEVSGNRSAGIGGAPRCRFTGTEGSTLLAGTRAISDNAWHTFECRKQDVGFYLLIDNVVVASQPRLVIGSMDLSKAKVAIGAKNGTFDEGDSLTGWLQDLEVTRG